MSAVATCTKCGTSITKDDWDGGAEKYLCPVGCDWPNDTWPAAEILRWAEDESVRRAAGEEPTVDGGAGARLQAVAERARARRRDGH